MSNFTKAYLITYDEYAPDGTTIRFDVPVYIIIGAAKDAMNYCFERQKASNFSRDYSFRVMDVEIHNLDEVVKEIRR